MTAQFDSLKTSSVHLCEMNNEEGVCHPGGAGFFILLYLFSLVVYVINFNPLVK